MKKIALAFAMVLTFGLLASCSNTVYQTKNADSDYSTYVYSASGTVTETTTSSITAGSTTTTSTVTSVVTVADVPSKTTVTKSSFSDSNYVTYTITIPYSKVVTTISGVTESTTSEIAGTRTLVVTKINDSYYVYGNNTDQVITFTDDGDKITISGEYTVSKSTSTARTTEVKDNYSVTLTKK